MYVWVHNALKGQCNEWNAAMQLSVHMRWQHPDPVAVTPTVGRIFSGLKALVSTLQHLLEGTLEKKKKQLCPRQ